jgi:HEPN domain-containing protein
MTEELKQYILSWFEKADNDIISAHLIIEHRPSILNVPCFLCQQAVEKYLKAFLIYKGKELVKTHNLNFLLNECALFDETFKEINFNELNNFGIIGRYPADIDGPELPEVIEYLQIAENVKQLVRSKIKLD